MVKTFAAGAALAAGLLLQSVAAGANAAPVAGGPAPATQEVQSAPAAHDGEAVNEAAGNANPSAASGIDNPATPERTTLEQVRAGMEQAQKRREALLKPDPAVADPAIHKELVERWGVEVIGVRQAAKGYMIDFRFRVLDADKALPLFDSRIQPFLLTAGTNIKLPVPVGAKVGAFRTTNRGKNIKAGKDYYMMFANPDSFAKPGEKVSVVIGDFRAENLTIR